MLLARLEARDTQAPLCVLRFDGVAVHIEGSEDSRLLLRLHAMFLSPLSVTRRNAFGAMERARLEPASREHFLACLNELDARELRVVLLPDSTERSR